MGERVVIVTGGAQGIGLACTRRFLEDGYKVVIADISDQAGQSALADFDAFGNCLRFIQTDISDNLEAVSYTHLTLPTTPYV